MKTSLMTLALAGLAATSRAEAPEGIRVEVTGVRSDKGDVRCGLYDAAARFPKEPPFKVAAAIEGKSAVCVFAGRPAGAYAVAVFHDENGNAKLDTNFVGAPKEGVGFSNGAKPKLGPPAFEAAKFTHDGKSTRVPVQLGY
jgi:uncharacterized protein (DUF2141 family)